VQRYFHTPRRGCILREQPSKNRVWDSLQVAQVVEWIIGIEDWKACGNNLIPEDAREGGLEVECIKGHTNGISRVRRANPAFT
jgi:hypothetical protein